MKKLTTKQKAKFEKELKKALEALFAKGDYRIRVTIVDDENKPKKSKETEMPSEACPKGQQEAIK